LNITLSGQWLVGDEPDSEPTEHVDEAAMTHVNTATADASINHESPSTRLIAGVRVSDTPLIAAVVEYAQRVSEPYLFNHAMRSWLFAEAIGRTKGIAYDHEIVAIGTILHDIGLRRVCQVRIASK
jgi:HD-GYP domain-containing protein (c-di-GMP phosphodiesterase class II)